MSHGIYGVEANRLIDVLSRLIQLSNFNVDASSVAVRLRILRFAANDFGEVPNGPLVLAFVG